MMAPNYNQPMLYTPGGGPPSGRACMKGMHPNLSQGLFNSLDTTTIGAVIAGVGVVARVVLIARVATLAER